MFCEFRNNSCVEDLSVNDEAGDVDLYWELFPALCYSMHSVESSVFLLLWSVGVFADVLESVICPLCDTITMLLLVALRNYHLKNTIAIILLLCKHRLIMT